MMDFAAIDFETATAKRDSACSVAVVEIRDGKLVDSYYSLIQPPGNDYHWFNTKIHGITREDTADAPDFAGIWPELSEHLAGRIVVAHNARFDMGVLAACLARQGLRAPQFSISRFIITMRSTTQRRVRPSRFMRGVMWEPRIFRHSRMTSACASSRLAGGGGDEQR